MWEQEDRALPHPDAGEWEWLLFRQHGVVSRGQALKFFNPKTVERHVAATRWRAVHRGVYATYTGPLTTSQRLWVASLAVGANGRAAPLGGPSALRLLGLRRFTTSAIHVLIPASRTDRDPPAGVRVHRTSRLPDADLHRTMSPPCTTAARSVVDAAQWAGSDREARTVIAMCFQQRLVGAEEVRQVLAGLKVKRRGLIETTVADASEGSETVTELDLVGLCRAGGLPLPTRQQTRVDSTGRTRYLDAVFEEWRIRVEIDGAHHMAVDHWWDDMRRHNALAVHGEVLLRFPAWMVRDHPAEVVATIRDALLSAGWRPQ